MFQSQFGPYFPCVLKPPATFWCLTLVALCPRFGSPCFCSACGDGRRSGSMFGGEQMGGGRKSLWFLNLQLYWRETEGIPHIFRPFWSSNWDCSLQHLGAGGPAPFDLCPWEDIYNSWPRRGGAPSGQLWSLQAIKVAVTWRAWILLDILTWLVEPKMCLFHSIRFFFGRLKLRSGQTKIGSTVCWFISSASADSCPHRLMIEFPSLCFRSIWLDFGYHPGDCRSLSHYCHLYPFIALLALWTLWTGYGKSLTISGLMVISTL